MIRNVFRKSAKGQSTVEYALASVVVITVLLAVVATAGDANNPLRRAIGAAFDSVEQAISTT